MPKSNDFANMPFDNLARHFVAPKNKPVPSKPVLQKQKNDAVSDDECILFLQSVENVTEKTCGKKHRNRASDKDQSFTNNPRVVKTSKSAEIETKVTAKQNVADLSQTQSGTDNAALVCNEEKLFLQNVSDVKPLNGCGREVPLKPEPSVKAAFIDEDFNFTAGKFEFSLLFSEEYFEGHVQGLDPIVFDKLRAGTFSPEAHIDFHGLNAVQAFESLRGFVKNAWYKGLRTILVIHGRGRNSPNGVGVLREKLQIWLTQDPFKRVVLAFCTAQPHDGGPGSIYLLLRKRKKKGKIYWEKTPLDSDLYEI